MMLSRKIAFIGTSCTGKTTLCNALMDDFDVVVVPEAARQYFSENPVQPFERFSVAVQGAIQDRVIMNEREAQSRHAPAKFLCDRSVVDAAVFVLFGGDLAGADQLFDRALEFLSTYSALVVLDPEDIPYVQDEIRIESAEDRMTIHRLFLDYLDHKEIEYKILSGSIDERAQQVRMWLSR